MRCSCYDGIRDAFCAEKRGVLGGDPINLERSHVAFSTTQWTLLGALASEDQRESKTACSALVERYWPPVYATLRRRGMKRDEAAEVTQAFFADVVLQRKLFERADRDRGKLRTLLLTALKRFLVDQHRRRQARGGGLTLPLDTLDREDRLVERASDFDSDELFERRWALAMLQEAMNRCEARFAKNGRAKHWQAFEARVVLPALACVEAEPLSHVAERVGFRNAADCAAAVRVVRMRVLTSMREVVAETVDGAEDADVEYNRALQMLM